MKRARWALVMLTVALAGCEPAEVTVRLRSPRRLEQRLTATVPRGRDGVVIAVTQSLFGTGWRVHRRTTEGQTALDLSRRIDPRTWPGIKVERRVIGPLGLRHEYRLSHANPFARLAATDLLRAAAAGQRTAVLLRFELPGRIVDSDSTPGLSIAGGEATWTFPLTDLAGRGQPPAIEAVSRAWRLGLLLIDAILLGLVLWVLQPVLWPAPEIRAERARRRAERRAARAARAAARPARAKPAKPANADATARQRPARGLFGRAKAKAGAPAVDLAGDRTDRTEGAAEAEPAAAEAEPPAAEAEPAAAEAEPPAAEAEPAAAEAEPPAAEAEPPVAEPPAAEAEPPAAEPPPADAESEPRA